MIGLLRGFCTKSEIGKYFETFVCIIRGQKNVVNIFEDFFLDGTLCAKFAYRPNK